jgi:hypothetical protein
MVKQKILIFFPNNKVSGEYLELFPFKELSDDYEFYRINGRKEKFFLDKLSFNLSIFTIKINALMHKSEMYRKRYSSVFYWARIRGFYPSRLDIQNVKVNFMTFKRSKFLEKFLVQLFGNIFGVLFLKKLNIFLFIFEEIKYRTYLNNFSFIILPYTGGISAEWDFLAWFSKKHDITSIAIQENWDNLSSKQFLFIKPQIFITWGKQSSSHLRTIQNFKGKVYELGNCRVYAFYAARKALSLSNSKSTNQLEHPATSVTVIGMGDEFVDLKLLQEISNQLFNSKDSNFSNFKFTYRVHPHTIRTEASQLILSKIKSLPFIDYFEPDLYETNLERVIQLTNSDIIVSTFSTMILEGSILNKHCIIPVFHLEDQEYNSANLIDDINHFTGISLLTNVSVASTLQQFMELLVMHRASNNLYVSDLGVLDWFCKDLNTPSEICKLIRLHSK